MPYLTLWISSPDTYSERRLGTDLTLSQLKVRPTLPIQLQLQLTLFFPQLKLEHITGIPYASQRVQLQRTTNAAGHGGAGEGPGEKEVLAVLEDEERTLEGYGVREWMTIRVDSIDPLARSSAGQFIDITQVDKFELTPEEYAARPDTVLAYIQRHQLGRFAPSSPFPSPSLPEAPLPANLVPSARCEVSLSPVLSRRGTVRFVGPTEFGPTDERGKVNWVGVEWDEPVGRGDGMVDGKRYFKTGPLRASFVRPDKVTVGDFPEIDPFAEEEDEEMEEM